MARLLPPPLHLGFVESRHVSLENMQHSAIISSIYHVTPYFPFVCLSAHAASVHPLQTAMGLLREGGYNTRCA